MVPDPASFSTTRNCTLYSNFVVSVFRNAYKSGEEIDDGKICQASPLEAYLFVTESLERVLRPSMCQFAQWYYNDEGPFCGNSYKTANDSEYLAKLFNDPLEICRQDVKASIGMGINLDIAGIGVCHAPPASIASISTDQMTTDDDCILHRGGNDHDISCFPCHGVGTFQGSSATTFDHVPERMDAEDCSFSQRGSLCTIFWIARAWIFSHDCVVGDLLEDTTERQTDRGLGSRNRRQHV